MLRGIYLMRSHPLYLETTVASTAIALKFHQGNPTVLRRSPIDQGIGPPPTSGADSDIILNLDPSSWIETAGGIDRYPSGNEDRTGARVVPPVPLSLVARTVIRDTKPAFYKDGRRRLEKQQ